MDLERRMHECKRRARLVYPHFYRAKLQFERLSRLWTYWENRAYEAQRELTEIRKVPANMTKKQIDRHKDRLRKAFADLPKDQQKILLAELKGGL
jgi:hypothetical protein